MYVNDDTLDQGKEVQEGLKTLYDLAYQGGFIPVKTDVTFRLKTGGLTVWDYLAGAKKNRLKI